jgi:hypothetical protein
MRLAETLAEHRWFLWAYNRDRRSKSRDEGPTRRVEATVRPAARTSPRGIGGTARDRRLTR